MADFNMTGPPATITDPGAPAEGRDPNFPRHLHRFGGEYVEVKNEAEQRAKLAEGWSLRPVLTAPAATGKARR